MPQGYFDTSELVLVPDSIETWADYDASSTGVDWDGFTTWAGTPNLPLEFTTEITDAGSIATTNYLCSVDSNYPVNITVRYGNTVDSTGGAIDSFSTVSVTPNQSLSGVKARYFQFVVSVDYPDSAGQGPAPFIRRIDSGFSRETIQRTITDLDTSTLPAGGTSYGAELRFRELTGLDGLSTITSLITQVQRLAGKYVEGATDTDYYVGPQDSTFDLYVRENTFTNVNVYVDKEPAVPRLYIETNTGEVVDCVIDAIAIGLPALSSDDRGNIVTT